MTAVLDDLAVTTHSSCLGPDVPVATRWNVVLKAKGMQLNISDGQAVCRPEDVPNGLDAACRSLEARMKSDLEVVMAREGNLKLHRDDLALFIRMFLPMDGE
jgi:hypothetical protein